MINPYVYNFANDTYYQLACKVMASLLVLRTKTYDEKQIGFNTPEMDNV